MAGNGNRGDAWETVVSPANTLRSRNSRDLTAVILAGGMGSRLSAVVADRPKGLAKVGGSPFLAHVLSQLGSLGLQRAILCTGHLGDQIREIFGNKYGPLALDYSHEHTALGTGGALRHALPMCDSDFLLVLNGDSWCEFNLTTLVGWQRARAAHAAIWLTWVTQTDRYGRVESDASGAITRLEEKGVEGPGWINSGVYLIERAMLQSLPDQVPLSLEREIFPRWIGRGLYAYAGGGSFIDIGTPESYADSDAFFSDQAGGNRHARGDRREYSTNGHATRRFVILDRDGTINVERHYLPDPDALELLPGAAEGLRRFRDLGLGVIVAANQSGIARGYFTSNRLDEIHLRLRKMLKAEGASVDGIYFCPHLPEDNCLCRKPAPELIQAASRDLGFRPEAAFFIGDKACDIELGRRLGGKTFLVSTGYGNETLSSGTVSADFVVDSLSAAAEIIEHLMSTDAP